MCEKSAVLYWNINISVILCVKLYRLNSRICFIWIKRPVTLQSISLKYFFQYPNIIHYYVIIKDACHARMILHTTRTILWSISFLVNLDDWTHVTVFLDNDQLDTHVLYFILHMFIIILYMFRALYAHHQEVELYWCIWYRHSWKVTVQCTDWKSPLSICASDGQTLESDDTRCCISTVHPPDDEHIMLETCRGL